MLIAFHHCYSVDNTASDIFAAEHVFGDALKPRLHDRIFSF